MNCRTPLILTFALMLLSGCTKRDDAPRIVNIVNFIRLCEPRYEEITEDMLFETTRSELELMDRYGFKGTFLLQYDALTEPRYPELLKKAVAHGHEVGGWWEITQPHVERAGLTWRGRYPWDWHADVDLATGYTPAERERLVDVYMEDFSRIFGVYPKAVGAWIIDAHTLRYMHERYGVEASCNMKDQVGTDGYTLWGGYWTGAYYPSRWNAYMPAQNERMQIPVPVFRMLGSDPVYQYDNGLGTGVQKVESLEPVYPESGGNPHWIRSFYTALTADPALGFAYAQTGQENSFTWPMIGKGLREQFAVLDSLNCAGEVRIELLTETARWFRNRYPVTPATAISVTEDHAGQGRQTVWYGSRFYRANLLLENGQIRFRDLHLFDEQVKSPYLVTPGTSSRCAYHTLPVVDGFGWSIADTRTGLYLCRMGSDSLPEPLRIRKIERIEARTEENIMEVRLTTGQGDFLIRLQEYGWTVRSLDKRDNWCVALLFAREKQDLIPIQVVLPDRIELMYDDYPYTLNAVFGLFGAIGKPAGDHWLAVWAIRPREGLAGVDCSCR